jgi:predicted transcriptional regulator
VSEELDFAAICEAISGLSPEARRRIVEEALASGYAAKDLADLMGVSPPAVSRYVHGTLAPSIGAVCRLLMAVDSELRSRLLVYAARSLWQQLEVLVNNLPSIPEVEELLAEIADKVSEKLAAMHFRKEE